MSSVRRLTAILAADVAGYSRLMGVDEEGTHERLKAHLGQLVEPKIKEHRGRTVKQTGDGLLAEFASVVDAVRCAVEVQRGMIDREPEMPDERRIRFRIGINLGDVIVEEHDIFGDGVNVAARLEALAEPGGICVSRMVRDQIRDKLPYLFEDRGEQQVKNITRPVRVYALRPEAVANRSASRVAIVSPRRRTTVLAAIATAAALVIAVIAWAIWATTKTSMSPAVAATTSVKPPLAAPRLSIVVLPFSNLSSDPEQQYLADGITEDLTTDLSRIEDMLVISHDSAFTYKDKPVNAKQIGRELGVRYVLEGSVQKSGKQVRINSQLIDAETDTHLWAERFDHDMADLFALQDEITGRIAVALNVELATVEATRPTEHPDAVDFILRAQEEFSKPPSRDRYTEQISLLERSLALDPRSVEAQSELANVLVGRVLSSMSNSASADIGRAEGLVSEALAASPRSPHAHFAKAQALRAQDRCDEAIPEYETALAVDRNWAFALFALSQCKLYAGSIEEAIPLLEKAVRLSPRDPNLGYWCFLIGRVHVLQSRADEAIPWLEKAHALSPRTAYPHAWLAAAYALKGESGPAAAELSDARRLGGQGYYSSIAQLKAAGYAGSLNYWGVPKIRALFEATYFAGLRKAGMPEE
jgi:adenylate cyclase